MPQSALRIGSTALVVLGITFAGSFTANAESIMKTCGAEWQAAKAARTTNGQTWQEFLKGCRAERASAGRGSGPFPTNRLAA